MEAIKIWAKASSTKRGKVRRLDGSQQVVIFAEVFGSLAVHSDHTDNHEQNAERWTVTHIPTGYAVQQGLMREDALRLVEELRVEPLSDAFWETIGSVDEFRAMLASGDRRLKYADERRRAAAVSSLR